MNWVWDALNNIPLKGNLRAPRSAVTEFRAEDANVIRTALEDIRTAMRSVSAQDGEVGSIKYMRSTGDLTDRTAELQALLDDGGHIYIGPGTYVISQVELQNYTRLQLHPAATLLRKPGATFNVMLSILNKHHITIEGGTIDGNSIAFPSERSHCIGFTGGQDVTIRNITLQNSPTSPELGSYGDGMYVGSGAGGAAVTRLFCENVTSKHNDRHAIFLVACTDSLFRNCTLSDTLTEDPGSALNLEPNVTAEVVQNLTFENCVMETSAWGLTANNHYDGDWKNILFDRCTFRNNRHEGAYMTGHNLHTPIRFQNCSFKSNGYEAAPTNCSGIFAYQAKSLTISGCRFHDNYAHGIATEDCSNFSITDSEFVRNGLCGIVLYQPTGSKYFGQILNCNIMNNGVRNSAGDKDGIRIQADATADGVSDVRLVIAHCVTGNQAAYAGGSRQQYGFRFTDAAGVAHADFGNLHDGNTSGDTITT